MRTMLRTILGIALAVSFVTLTAPAHAQWVVVSTNPVTGTLTVGTPAMSGGATAGGGLSNSDTSFTATSDASGSAGPNASCNSSFSCGGQWQQTYMWQGSGSGTYPFYVNEKDTVNGSTSSSGTANAGCGSSADGIGGTNNYNKTPPAFDTTFSSASASLKITVAAGCSGGVANTPIGGGFDTSNYANVTLGNPSLTP